MSCVDPSFPWHNERHLTDTDVRGINLGRSRADAGRVHRRAGPDQVDEWRQIFKACAPLQMSSAVAHLKFVTCTKTLGQRSSAAVTIQL